MEIVWRTSLNVAAIHAAWCVERWPNHDLKVPVALKAAAAGLIAAGDEFEGQKGRFWEAILRLAPDFDDSKDLASSVAEEFMCDEQSGSALIATLPESIFDVQESFQRCNPNFDSEVRWRMNPIRDLWEAYGPGLSHSMCKLAGVPKSAHRCEIFAVLPHRGGVGYVHGTNMRLHLELLLTNRHPRIPETLHLAWLIAQANQYATLGIGEAMSDRERWLDKLGWIPATFAAAENLDVSELNPTLVAKAIELWWVHREQECDQLAERLIDWWGGSQTQSMAWSDRLLSLNLALADLADVSNADNST